MEKRTARKATRKITALDFSGENAAVALVSKEQGGAANGFRTLMVKSANFSEEFIQKMQTVRVEMEVPDFIEAFFKLEEDQAKALAFLLGWREDLQEEAMESEMDFNKWVNSNMKSFEILKSLKDSKDFYADIASLSEDEMLTLVQEQELFEKALKQSKESTEVAKAAEADVNTSIASEVKGKGTSPVVNKSKKGNSMTDKVTVVEELVETEMIAKSQFEAIQKQAQEQAELLKAAMQELEVFKAEKAAFIAKARKQALVDAAKDEAKADQLFKAVGSLEDADFNAVVEVVKALATAVEKSDLFVEKGASAESEVTPVQEESLVAKAIKAKLQANK